MSEQFRKKVIIIAMLLGIPFGCYQLYAINFGPRTDDAAIVQPSSRLDKFSAMRAGLEKKEEVGPDEIEELAGGKSEPSIPAELKNAAEAPILHEKFKSSECDQNGRLFDGKECPPMPIQEKSTSSEPENQRVASTDRGAGQNRDKEPLVRRLESSLSSEARGLLAWKGLTSTRPGILQGTSRTYPGPVIRAGCRVLAEVEDELRVTKGEEHLLTLAVKGAMPGCKLPNVSGIRLVAYASLNSSGNRILATVKQCSDSAPDRKSQPCKARVKSITGFDGLEGEIYDISGWGILLDAALSIGTAPTIAKLTQAASQATTLWTAQASAAVADTLQKALNRVAEKIEKVFDGREIRLAQKALVIVTFEEDTSI